MIYKFIELAYTAISKAKRFLWSFVVKKIGYNVKIGSGTIFTNPQNLTIGEGVIISRYCNIQGATNSVTKIGNYVEINKNVWIAGDEEIQIGDDTLIGPNCNILSSDHAYSDRGTLIRKQGRRSGKIVIGNDVWIAAGVTVLPGVNIGNGSVVGANAVVAGDIPAYSVAVGVPAKVIKKR